MSSPGSSNLERKVAFIDRTTLNGVGSSTRNGGLKLDVRVESLSGGVVVAVFDVNFSLPGLFLCLRKYFAPMLKNTSSTGKPKPTAKPRYNLVWFPEIADVEADCEGVDTVDVDDNGERRVVEAVIIGKTRDEVCIAWPGADSAVLVGSEDIDFNGVVAGFIGSTLEVAVGFEMGYPLA